MKQPPEKANRYPPDRFVPDKPAKNLAEKKVQTQLAVIHAEVYQKGKNRGENHVNKVLNEDGTPLRAEHGTPDPQDVINRAEQQAQREEDQKAECLGEETLIHAVSLPYLNSLENTPPPEVRFSVYPMEVISPWSVSSPVSRFSLSM